MNTDPRASERSWALTRSQDTRHLTGPQPCPECGETRRTYETLRAHRVLAHNIHQ